MKIGQARRILVTGAASGIGKAVAEALSARGDRVFAADISADTPSSVAHAFTLDVRDVDACKALMTELSELDPHALDGLVNCAGMLPRMRIEESDAAAIWRETVDVNLTGSFNLLHAALSKLRTSGASVVLVASIQSFIHLPNSVAYSSSKVGLAMLVQASAAGLGPTGVWVNAVAPGPIKAGMTEAAFSNDEIVAKYLARMPLGHLGAPLEVVGPIEFLLSEASGFVTGAVIPGDGGYLTT